MLINGGEINGVVINGDRTIAETVTMSIQQTVSAITGDTALALTQSLAGAGDSALDLLQSVVYPSGDTALALVQRVNATGEAGLTLSQNVYSIASVADSWTNWDILPHRHPAQWR